MFDIVRYENGEAARNEELFAAFSASAARRVRRFHESIPDYAPTPLISLEALARELGVGSIFVKDESKRFGLNAFKALGGSYAIAALLGKKLGFSSDEILYPRLTEAAANGKLKDMCFITATDGNHGRGIAWTAKRLGVKSLVLMPEGSSAERLENIRKLGADARITDLNYDDAVRLAADMAAEKGFTLVQDTAWDGYEEIPTRIMQGYLTMASEAAEQLAPLLPTHIFLQAGVGSMAAATAAYFTDICGAAAPVITITEPNAANCFYRTAKAADGRLHKVGGALRTEMAGLACGEPNPLAWDILRHTAAFYASVPDEVTERGMRLLGHPLPGTPPVTSGESGAVTTGLVHALLHDEEGRRFRDMLGLGPQSRILCISTEGDTDRSSYERIMAES